MKLYLKKKAGADAVGEYDLITREMVVKKGSTVTPDVRTEGKFRSANSVLKYREMYCKDGITTKDVVFKSASTAANFVTGRSTNGLLAWRDKSGKTLRAIMDELQGE